MTARRLNLATVQASDAHHFATTDRQAAGDAVLVVALERALDRIRRGLPTAYVAGRLLRDTERADRIYGPKNGGHR